MRVLLLCCLLGCCGMAACKKKEHDVKQRVETAGEVKAYAGKNRVKLTWTLPGDFKSGQCTAYWNGAKDSLVKAIPAGSRKDSMIIDHLQEGTYTFYVALRTATGAASEKVAVQGTVYGERYAASLKNRTVFKMHYDDINAGVSINWNGAVAGAAGSQISYRDSLGTDRLVFVPSYYSSTTLENVMPDKDTIFRYRTLYIPAPGAIDTFYTAYKTVTIADGLPADGMIIESLRGRITLNELTAFKRFINKYDPNAGQNFGNVWVYGNPAHAVEACGLMYEATGDIDILNRMIFYCDRILAGRDDLASAADGGQLILWTGKVEPVWPSGTGSPAGAGIEQGEVFAHLAFCARLILETPSIWDVAIPDGDPDGFGITYKQRALKYIQESDYVMDEWILPRFIRTSDHNRFYFPGAPNTYKPDDPAPWNQMFMLTDGMIRLTECHVLLGDAPDRVAQYDAIVKPNLEWFFSTLQKKTSSAGTPVYDWDYALHAQTEDANHFAYEAAGLWIAYDAGRYGLSPDELIPFANTYHDVILAKKQDGKFAGRVDGTTGTGHAGGDDYVRWEYYYLADFRPDIFEKLGRINIDAGHIKSAPAVTALILWLKQRRYDEGIQ